MKPVEVAPGVFRLGSAYLNWYLVVEDGQVTVMDAAVPGYLPQLEPALAALGLTLSDVAAVLITHKHVDHIGLAEPIRSGCEAEVFIHEREGDDLRDMQSATPPGFYASLWRPQMVGFGFHLLRNGINRTESVRAISTFRDGEVLDVPGRPKVIFTPGHSPGHSCFYLEDRGALFTGDAIVTRIGATGKSGARLMNLNDDVEQARNSLVKLERLDAPALLPGHGDPWSKGVAEAVRSARIT